MRANSNIHHNRLQLNHGHDGIWWNSGVYAETILPLIASHRDKAVGPLRSRRREPVTNIVVTAHKVNVGELRNMHCYGVRDSGSKFLDGNFS